MAGQGGNPSDFVDRRSFGEVLEAEHEKIGERRGNKDLDLGPIAGESPVPTSEAKAYRGDGTVGLAFSGGGIRSATFCLGIMQRLAKENLLRHVDYLSTVSGGGYIGSSLTWFLSRFNNEPKRFGVGKNDLPFGTGDPRRAPLAALGAAFKTAAAKPHDTTENERILRYLRQHGEYLAPGKGITLLSGIAVVLRAILLNLIIVTIFSAAAIYLLMLAMLACPTFFKNFALFAKLEGCCVWPEAKIARFDFAQTCSSLFVATMLHFAAYIFGLFVLLCAIYSVFTFFFSDFKDSGYKWRRFFESKARWLIAGSGVGLIFAAVPWADLQIKVAVDSLGEAGSLGVLLPGVASGAWTFYKSLLTPPVEEKEKSKEWIPLSLIASIAAALLLFGVALASYQLANYLMGFEAGSNFIIGGVIVAFILSVFVDLNRISIHRFYRDRLMETFLPDPDDASMNATGPSWTADVAALSGMANACGPYHLINANLLTVDSEDRRYRLRGGDSFIFSPLFCGSRSIGWRKMASKGWADFSLATAMAISGAAANPNAGSGGVGITRNRLVSLVMTLLSVRLGYWTRNPYNVRPLIRHRPNHIYPGLTALLPSTSTKKRKIGDPAEFKMRILAGFSEDGRWVQLSDGGHFENLGLYELFRRRCRLVIACDGGADPNYEFKDLQNAIQRAADDFGVRIQFSDSMSIEHLRPKNKSRFWSVIDVAVRGYAVATIHYPALPNDPNSACDGTLIFMTTTLIDGLGMNLLGYKLVNPAFPDQSTADQFFDEMQFEAYRELGWCIAEQMLAGTGMKSVNVPGKGHYLAVP